MKTLHIDTCLGRIALISMTFALATFIQAEVPEVINYQGRVVDDSTLVNGTVTLTIGLYTNDTPTGGEAVLYEDEASVVVSDGLFSTLIGDDTVTIDVGIDTTSGGSSGTVDFGVFGENGSNYIDDDLDGATDEENNIAYHLTVGQTFTISEDNTHLTEFRFSLRDAEYGEDPAVSFMAYLLRWDSMVDRAVGGILYQSTGQLTIEDNVVYEYVFGGLDLYLDAGTYVACLFQNNAGSINNIGSVAITRDLAPNGPYSDGNLVTLTDTNSFGFAALTNVPWTVDADRDAAWGAELEAAAPLSSALAYDAVYLQVSVDGTPMLPREQLSSVAYALKAKSFAGNDDLYVPLGLDVGGDASVAGNLTVGGTLVKSAGSFRIDHPLDPANKYLSHSFVESPDMKNVYDGVAELDANGDAVVQLPDWFEVLNKDFRYQLTCIGGFAPVYIAEEVSGNSFRIAGGKPDMKVSWQITGIRQDAYANDHRIPVEEDKLADKNEGVQ